MAPFTGTKRKISFGFVVLTSLLRSSLGLVFRSNNLHCHPTLQSWTSSRNTQQYHSSTKLCVLSTESDVAACFDAIVKQRYACTRFQKHDDSSPEHRQVVQDALKVLELAQRAPSGFNVQPWRAIVVTSPEAKKKVAKYNMGNNPNRILDSDCTVVFLADKESGRELARFGALIRRKDEAIAKATNRAPASNRTIRITQAITLLFSSGYPFPRWIQAPFSFCVRLGAATVSALTRRRVLVPSLSNAECWASKNCMLFAMSYILGCTSRNLATAPMEGFNAGGIRKALGIPKRFGIPLIVSTGKPLVRGVAGNATNIVDSGLTTTSSASKHIATERYAINEVLYQDEFGKEVSLIAP
eukprot:CAMPEP_0172416992 /NCGR_PEP_ID=MMETSP1064-20121228/3506_1 /TAXON_ID=202472 /ORGANISM="Aulacoseira subarctica , Strain CCAP 1002/5" /LENGTH=355 /DNA_ID=CAMNT_0013155025 /DNA_START=17 /DNA_END=1084 /DNA_ORIENTATION=-